MVIHCRALRLPAMANLPPAAASKPTPENSRRWRRERSESLELQLYRTRTLLPTHPSPRTVGGTLE